MIIILKVMVMITVIKFVVLSLSFYYILVSNLSALYIYMHSSFNLRAPLFIF